LEVILSQTMKVKPQYKINGIAHWLQEEIVGGCSNALGYVNANVVVNINKHIQSWSTFKEFELLSISVTFKICNLPSQNWCMSIFCLSSNVMSSLIFFWEIDRKSTVSKINGHNGLTVSTIGNKTFGSFEGIIKDLSI
jgi:hypothetical protein